MVFWQLTIDTTDPERLIGFWAAALGYQPVPPSEPDTPWYDHYRARLGNRPAFRDRLFDPAGVGPALWFQTVPESKSGKNRLHLDLYPTGRDRSLTLEERATVVDARVTELTALGATVQRTKRFEDPQDPIYYVVLHDPEGNEFCVGS